MHLARIARAPRSRSLLLLGALLALCACSKSNDVDASTNVGSSCQDTPSSLAALCPPGTALELTGSSATGESVCPAGEGEVKDTTGKVTGLCRTTTSCSVQCKVVQTCPCGIDSATRDGVVCAKCACGDGLCQGNERASCPPGDPVCVPCLEDCAGANCGDGVCNGTESPQSCPQDCAGKCEPNKPVCAGNKVLLCGADGQPAAELADCLASGQVCGNGKCGAKDICGNGLCDGAESPSSCPQDCMTVCVPGSISCKGPSQLQTCSADGKEASVADCPAGQVCGNGKCGAKDVCGNGLCEANESATLCPDDCKANVCGNGQCEVGESPISCPSDCSPAVCGNQMCEKDEQQTCPQDCPLIVCKPNDRRCLSLAILEVCNAAGTMATSVNCAGSGQLCGAGQCAPKLVCGNGACEPDNDEDMKTCPGDCTAACGNGKCDKPYENAQKCSSDCKDECGDGYCTGAESPKVCELDCPVDCGNGVCDSGETRKNCSKDCGFCGDDVCQPEETPAPLAPPDGSKEPCAQDCLKVKCAAASDCDDQVDCTIDTCGADGKCAHVADDSACGGGKCLGVGASPVAGSGGCVDEDGDTFLAASCGGNDCFDSPTQADAAKYGSVLPAQVNPGSLGEVCDGIDRNCNGSNQAKITASNESTLPLTPESSDAKTSLEVAMQPNADGSARRFVLAWVATTPDGPALQYAVTDPDGVLLAPGVQTVTTDPAVLAGVVYSPERDQFAIAWTTCPSALNVGHMAWISLAAGDLGALVDAFDPGDLHFDCEGGPKKATFARAQEAGGLARYTLFQMGGSQFGPGCGPVPEAAGHPLLIGEDASVVKLVEHPGWLCNGGNYVTPVGFVNERTRFDFYFRNAAGASGSPYGLFSWKPSGGAQNTVPVAGFNWASQAPSYGFDGTAIVAVTPDSEGLRYQRIDPVSYAAFDAPTADPSKPGQLIKAKLTPSAIVTNAKDTVVAIAGTDLPAAATNLMLLLRNQADGSALIPAGIMAKGDDLQNVRLIWDGSSFRAFYTSKIKGRQQVYTAPLRCD
jgi:hypothetical protein